MLIKDLIEKRARAFEQMNQISEKGKTEKRMLTSEEQQSFDRAFQEVGEIKAEIEREERLQQVDAELRAATREPVAPAMETRGEKVDDASQKAFRSWISGGSRSLNETEYRALQKDAATSGGNIVAPTQFVNKLLESLANAVHVRAKATKYQLDRALQLTFPKAGQLSDVTWTTEIIAAASDATTPFSQVSFIPSYLAKEVKVSRPLLRTSGVDVEGYIIREFSRIFGAVEESAFMVGEGDPTNSPVGIFAVTHADKLPTTRDCAGDNTTTAIASGSLIDAKYKIHPALRAGAEWFFSTDALKQIAKLKDKNDQFLWRVGLAAGEPDTILGLKVNENAYVPATFTAGKYVGALANLAGYYIVDSLNMEMQRLDELYAGTNQVGFIARKETTGKPVEVEAFARIKLAAS